MRAAKVRRYLRAACAVAAASGGIALLAAWLAGPGGAAWVLLGWIPLSAVGVGAGAAVASQHDRPGAGFLAALLAGMLARLTVVAAGVGLAAWTGGSALGAHLEGLLLGFVPLQVHEVVFFWREGRRPATQAVGR